MPDKLLQKEQDTIVIPIGWPPEIRANFDTAYLDAGYWNGWPMVTKDPINNEPHISFIKRAGTTSVPAMSPTIASYGTYDDMVCLANEPVTQLYDIYIAAFFDANNSKIYIIQYRPIAGTTTLVGTITGCNINDLIFITEITDSDNLVPAIAISYQKSDKSSGTGYYAESVAGVFGTSSLTVINSGSFPANLGTPKIITGPFVSMNGHHYIMTLDGYIYMSSLTASGNPDITTWNTAGTVVASQYPDRGVGLNRYKQYIAAFGQDSIEFFEDVGNPPPGSTLQSTSQLFVKFGIRSPKLMKNIDDNLYWVSYGSTNTLGVWMMGGIGIPMYMPAKISTLWTDSYIQAQFTQAVSSLNTLEAIVLQGRKHIIINNIATFSMAYGISVGSGGSDTYPISNSHDLSANIIAYSIEDKEWWNIGIAGALSNCYALMPATAYTTDSSAGTYTQYIFKRTGGATGNRGMSSTRPCTFNVFTGEATGLYYDDNPDDIAGHTVLPITVCINFPTARNSTNKRKFIKRLSASMEPVFLATGDSNIYSFYFVWNKLGDVSNAANTSIRGISVPNNLTTSGQRFYINNLGAFRRIDIGIVVKHTSPMEMDFLELEIYQGTH